MCFTGTGDRNQTIFKYSVDLTIVVIVTDVSWDVFVTEEGRRKHQSGGQFCLLSRWLMLKYDLNIIVFITHVQSVLLF